MVYWVIALAWCVGGTFVFWCFLSFKWAKLDPFFVRTLDTFRTLNPIPGYPRYMDLKFTLLRHAVAFLISAVAIFFVKINFILTLILFLNVLYAYIVISRYRYRKRYLAETAKNSDSEALLSFISIPVKDSFCTVVFSVLCVVILYILYAFRP